MSELTIFALRSSNSLSLLVKGRNGKSFCVRFEPITSFGILGESEFATADEEVVEAMKAHKRYGIDFFLKSEGRTVRVEATPRAFEHDQTVTSRNKAIEYLHTRFNGASFTQTSNIEEMKKEAFEKYGVVFDNWK